jgi:hypothetical protein
MPEISITDDLGKPVEAVKLDLSQPSSLATYARTQALHLIVVPEFVALAGTPLPQAAPMPIKFQATLGNAFQLGTAEPKITLAPKVQAVLRADAVYAGLEVTGSFGAGATVAAGDLSFGLNAASSVTFAFDKTFATAAPAPTLGDAVGRMLAAFVIPASVADLGMLAQGDVASVSGQGSLKLTAGFDIAAPVNPLASVKLPLNAGSLDVKDGLMAGVSAAVTLSGGYRIQACGLAGGAVGLRFEKRKGAEFRTDITASASASVKYGGADLLAGMLGAIGPGGADPALLAGLTDEETQTFNAALKEGVDHSLQASLDLALSTAAEDDALFEYEIQPGALDEASTAAVNHALRGDLTTLTGLQSPAGVTLRGSMLTRLWSRGVSLKVNLLGIVNLISLAKLVAKCEILSDPSGGGVTIKETAQSDRISAISDPYLRQEALRKAIFEAVLVTTTYRASGAVAMPNLHCANLHFVANRNTSEATVRGYLNWFAGLNMIARGDVAAALAGYGGEAASTCLLRTELDDAACENLFLADGVARGEAYYREFGRQALRAMLHPESGGIEQARYRFLDAGATWTRAVEIGPSPELRRLIPLNPMDPRFDMVLAVVTGDLYDILWWAESMAKAAAALLVMRQFLKGRDPLGLKDDPQFQRRCENLQQLMMQVVAKSKARFGEPWGMVALFWSAGSPAGASGMVRAGGWSVARP